jgi:formylglycine-generating enzyme required for sulfatase activity
VLGGVFICYRREDSAGFARLIYDRLTHKLGRESVFFDVDNIPVGLDFVDILSERVGKCEALIAVIGKSWASTLDAHNRRRLDDPNDFVRIEIEAALARKVRVIPVLVDGAAMPGPDDLPESLKKLTRRQGIEISHTRFDSDVERLTKALSLLEEELRQREASEAERAADVGRERREAEEAAASAEQERRLAEAEATRRADQERRGRETTEAERAAQQEPKTRAVAKAVEAQQTGPFPLAQMHSARTWRAPLLLVGAAALIVGWFLLARIGPPQGNAPAVESSVSGLQPHEADATRSGQAASPNPPPAPASQEQSLTPTEEENRGDRYLYVEQDYAKAMEWYRKAADQGYPDAQRKVGLLYENGWGVANDIAQARVWYQKAGEQGNVEAKAALQGLQPQPNPSKETALPGPPPVTTLEEDEMGDRYLFGRGVEQDYAKAMEWYRKAADQGFPDAQRNVGVLYENGWGVAKDIDQARVWYQKAADQAYGPAKTALARLQPRPNPPAQSGPPSPSSATTPQEQSLTPAEEKEEGDRYFYRRGVVQDYAKAMERYRKAADRGLADAQYSVAFSYERGLGVDQDLAEALARYQKAADQGYGPAEAALARLQPQQSPSAQSAPNPRPVANQAEKSTASASPLTEVQERALKPGDSFKECGDCPEMIVVPAGRFIMGSPPGQGSDHERPLHEVTIAKHFAVAKFELTFDEWDACVTHGDCNPRVDDHGWGRGQQPAINVSWDHAQTYVNWLSRTSGETYRLLSEAEYEYVARAGSESKYPWGDGIDLNGQAMANCNGCGSDWDNKQTAPVGSFAANRFGLYDMVGNVSEWIADCWRDDYRGALRDGSASAVAICHARVIRGGSWQSAQVDLRPRFRTWVPALTRNESIGFRVARTLSP